MGLDMSFYSGDTEIAYFRKHADLNGFLQKLWLEKHPGKSPDAFNCKKFQITKAILNKLIDFVDGPHNEHYSGFFWGVSTDEDWEETRKVLEDLEQRLKNKEKIYYWAWW